jgi:hypothetical protein
MPDSTRYLDNPTLSEMLEEAERRTVASGLFDKWDADPTHARADSFESVRSEAERTGRIELTGTRS